MWANSLLRSRFPAAIAGGLLLAMAFPKIGVAGLAWIAPALIYSATFGKGAAQTFRIGYVAGLAYYLASLYWLLLIPYRWMGIPLGPATGWLALGAFLAVYMGAWVWMINNNKDSEGLLAPSWWRRQVWTLSGAAVWVALEMIVARFGGGFPWNLLGASQYRITPLIQIASITGIYGVSFLVVWFSLSLASAAVAMVRRPTTRSVWVGELLLPMLTVAACFNFGFRQVRRESQAEAGQGDSNPPPTLHINLIQPSIPQTLIWDESNDETRFQDLLRLSDQVLTNRADLLVWPEAAVPKLLRYDLPTYEAVTNLAGRHHVWLIIGADDAQPLPGATNLEGATFYNASFLVSPQGRIANSYRKRALVIFGEYIPLAHWLPFLKWFTPIQGGYTPGRRPVQFALTDLHVKTATLICYEDMFPQLAREYVEDDTDFLVNLTNDGWFGESAAQWQQAASALFRAVENGRPLVRCANNGLTCWVDSCGRLREIFRNVDGSVYGPGTLSIEVPLLAKGRQRPLTFYHQHGDWFGWACVAVAVLKLGRRMLARR